MIIPFVTITLDKAYECRFDLSTTLRYQQLTGKKFTGVAEVTVDNVAELLWPMLKKHIPDLTLDGTTELIDACADSIFAIIHLVAACIDSAYNLDEKSPNVKALAATGRMPNLNI